MASQLSIFSALPQRIEQAELSDLAEAELRKLDDTVKNEASSTVPN